MATDDLSQTPFVKQLAANDRPTREAALKSLTTFLTSRRTLTPLDHLKIQTALFYTLWHTDRPLPQQSLTVSLSTLLLSLPPSTLIPYTHAFFQTMAREWTNIDVLRMEKFLLLVRRMVCSMIGCMKQTDWKEGEGGLMEGLIGVWKEYPFNIFDIRVPMGMRFHCLDVYVDEIERVGGVIPKRREEGEEKQEGDEGNLEVLERLLEPVRELSKACPTKAVRNKAKEVLADERLPGNEKVEEPVEEEEEWGGFDD